MKIFSLVFCAFLMQNITFALTVDDDKLKESYSKYDSLYKSPSKNDSIIFLHGITKFSGKEALSIVEEVKDNSKLSQEKRKFIADYYYSLGSYITSAKLYREYLENEPNPEIVASLLTTDIIASKFDDFKNDLKEYGDILPEYAQIYFNLLKLHKTGENSKALDGFSNIEIEELFIEDFTYKIKAHSLKLEILVATNNTTEAARLAKYLVDNFEKLPESRRWIDLYPSLGKMVKDKSTVLDGASSTNKKSVSKKTGVNSNVYYGYQFGSFSSKENADKLKKVLDSKYKSKGVSIYVRKQNKGSKSVFIVTTHAFQTEKNARDYYEKEYKKVVKDKMFFVKIYK